MTCHKLVLVLNNRRSCAGACLYTWRCFSHPHLTSSPTRSLPPRPLALFFYPKDFTFVCPTEIIAFSDRAKVGWGGVEVGRPHPMQSYSAVPYDISLAYLTEIIAFSDRPNMRAHSGTGKRVVSAWQGGITYVCCSVRAMEVSAFADGANVVVVLVVGPECIPLLLLMRQPPGCFPCPCAANRCRNTATMVQECEHTS